MGVTTDGLGTGGVAAPACKGLSSEAPKSRTDERLEHFPKVKRGGVALPAEEWIFSVFIVVLRSHGIVLETYASTKLN